MPRRAIQGTTRIKARVTSLSFKADQAGRCKWRPGAGFAGRVSVGRGLGHHWDSDTSVVWTPPHGGPTHSLPLPPGGRRTQSFRPGTWLICLDRASVGLATQAALPAQPPQLLTLRSPKESRCPTSCCGPSTHNSLSISRVRTLQSQVPGRQPQAARE